MVGEGDTLVHRDLTKPSEQILGAVGMTVALQNEAERLSDLSKMAVLVRSLFDSGDHTLGL